MTVMLLLVSCILSFVLVTPTQTYLAPIEDSPTIVCFFYCCFFNSSPLILMSEACRLKVCSIIPIVVYFSSCFVSHHVFSSSSSIHIGSDPGHGTNFNRMIETIRTVGIGIYQMRLVQVFTP